MRNQPGIQQRLQALIHGVRERWTYGIFWQSSLDYSGETYLGWGDGYFVDDYDMKAKSKGLVESSSAEQEHRKRVFRELNSLIAGTESIQDDIDEEVTDAEWFFLVSMTRSFANGNGLPGQAFFHKSPVWVAGSDRLGSSSCERARQSKVFGLQTMVCIPLGNGVIELGSTGLIYHSSDLMNKARILFHFSSFEVGSSPFRAIYSDQGVNDKNDQSSIRISRVEIKGKEFLSPATSIYSENRWKYDIFLSFRGADTRNTFTGHLYQALCNKGINTFIDDKLERGEEISPALLRVIEESRISIVIFSENYANSSCCLDELVKILECRESKRSFGLHVDPSHVEEQKGSFGLRFYAGSCGINLVKLLQWKAALMKAAGLSGWHLENGHESRYIQSIVDRVLSILNRTFLHVADYPVGLDSHINDITYKLSIGSNDVCMIGIWGIGGIGKTTVAKAIYNKISIQFEGSCFLANVREISKQYSVVQLQENLLSQILGHQTFLMGNFDMGINVIKARLRRKRVLVVIDDVDSVDQLKKLAGELDWFGAGSRIIITSRDKHLLVSHGVKCVHKMEELGPTDALLLFSWTAFRKPQPAVKFLELSHEVVNYAKGLPLALSVLGSFLYDRSVHEWECELDKLKRIPNRQIHEILKISYDGLEENEKSIFLDIACFFRGMDEDYVINILHACNLNPVIGIKVLTEKSLISIENKKLQMHDLLQAMGRRIVHEESPHLPSRRSRLWFHEDVLHVLTENMGTDEIEGIMLDLHESEEVQLSANVFEKMTRLQILIIRNAQLTTGPINLPNELKWVEWPGYPFSLVPSAFHFRARKLVGLEMISSSIRQFEGFKNYSYLKFLDFKDSKFLTETPDVSTIPNLERLNLEGCINLVEVHESVGCLCKLKFLSLQFCSNLRSLPSKFKLISLDTFLLTACEKLEAFPDIVEMMPRLGKLCLSGTALKALPSSIKNITHLKVLILTYCKELTDLPCSIYELRHLEHLLLEGCSKLGKYPVNVLNKTPSNSSLGFLKLEWLDLQKCSLVDVNFLTMHEFFPTLKELDLSGNNFVVLPAIFSVFTNLKCLKLSECKKLQEIPDLPLNIRRLEARDCDLLERYSQLVRKGERPTGLCIIDFSNCHKLAKNQGKFLENASLSQGFEKCFPIDICLPGSEVPDWFTYRTETGSLTFRVPLHLSQEIKALVFCTILCFEDGITASLSCETLIDGESAFSCSRQFLLLQSDHMWFYCHPYPNDKAFAPERNHAVNFEISFEVLGAPAGAILGRCGVHLVYKKDKTVNDPSTIRCTSHHIESVSLDPRRSCYSNDLELNLNPISNRKRMADDQTAKQLSLFSQARNENLTEPMMGCKTGELQQEQSLSSFTQSIERRFNLQRKVRRQSSTLTKENKK